MARMSGWARSASFPVSRLTALPTSRFISDLRGSGDERERSLQTISSLSAIRGGTRVPIRNVLYSIPSSSVTIFRAHSSVEMNTS